MQAVGFEPKVIFDVGGSNGAWTYLALEIYPAAMYELFEPLTDVNDDRAVANWRQSLRFPANQQW